MIMHKTFVSARLAAVLLGTTMIATGGARADTVIPDDLIVQGSACVGLDCVNNESFGFDTIRLKENNTRLKFDDTSTGAGFPANDWQITANDSASGGASYLAFDDVTGATQPFRVTAGAPTASLFVDSTGKVGLRTSTPVLDLSIKTGNTPGARLEQDSSGGFTAQTWDIAGNEANFFVRDVTGGSRLPFRIRPGAPTSSIDINASGNVGLGTASPGSRLHVSGAAAVDTFAAFGPSATGSGSDGFNIGYGGNSLGVGGGFINAHSATGTTGKLVLLTDGLTRMTIGPNVGIGTTAPGAQLHTTGTVRFAGVASCGSGIQSNASGDLSCIVSSRQFKNIAGELPANVALANVMALRPQTGSYKETPNVPEHWLIAEEVAAVDPALIGLNDGKPYVVKTQNVVADLVAVVQQQTKLLNQQQARIDALEQKLSTRQ
jgi:Chaperone of endosialidase